MNATVSLTVSEASWVLERPAAAINRAVDRGLIEADRSPRAAGDGGPPLRKVGAAALRYLLVEDELEEALTPAARRLRWLGPVAD